MYLQTEYIFPLSQGQKPGNQATDLNALACRSHPVAIELVEILGTNGVVHVVGTVLVPANL